MAKPPNYGQDRRERERAQAARTQEKLDRKAEETARRKALKSGEPGSEPGKTD
jgi:hypothetical protein